MKIAQLFGGRPEPRIGAAVVEDSLITGGCAFATTLIVSAEGGSLQSLFDYLWSLRFALFGG